MLRSEEPVYCGHENLVAKSVHQGTRPGRAAPGLRDDLQKYETRRFEVRPEWTSPLRTFIRLPAFFHGVKQARRAPSGGFSGESVSSLAVALRDAVRRPSGRSLPNAIARPPRNRRRQRRHPGRRGEPARVHPCRMTRRQEKPKVLPEFARRTWTEAPLTPFHTRGHQPRVSPAHFHRSCGFQSRSFDDGCRAGVPDTSRGPD